MTFSNQFQYDNATPADDPVGFLDTPEGMAWFLEAMATLMRGGKVANTDHQWFLAELSDDPEYTEACQRYITDLHFAGNRHGSVLMADIRKCEEAVCRRFLESQADKVADAIRKQSETDAKLAGVE